MNYKQIMLNLIEFNHLLSSWLDDMGGGDLADEEKSVDWNDGVYDALEKIYDALEEFGLVFTDEDADTLDLYKLDDLEED